MIKLRTVLLATGLSALLSFPAFAEWTQEIPGTWRYEENGEYVTDDWVKYDGNWYYLDDNGVMAANRQYDFYGTEYAFDASGKWIFPDVYNHIYQNTDIGYSIDIPPYMLISIVGIDETPNIKSVDVIPDRAEGVGYSFSIESYYANYTFQHKIVNEGIDPSVIASEFDEIVKNDLIAGGYSYVSKTAVQLGDLPCTKTTYRFGDFLDYSAYTYVDGNKIMFITCVSLVDDGMESDILQTMRKLQ